MWVCSDGNNSTKEGEDIATINIANVIGILSDVVNNSPTKNALISLREYSSQVIFVYINIGINFIWNGNIFIIIINVIYC